MWFPVLHWLWCSSHEVDLASKKCAFWKMLYLSELVVLLNSMVVFGPVRLKNKIAWIQNEQDFNPFDSSVELLRQNWRNHITFICFNKQTVFFYFSCYLLNIFVFFISLSTLWIALKKYWRAIWILEKRGRFTWFTCAII